MKNWITPESSTLLKNLGPNRLPKQSGAQNKDAIKYLNSKIGKR